MVASKSDFLKEGALIAEMDVRWDHFDQSDFQTWRESLRLPIETTVKKRRQGDNMGKPAGDLEG